MTKVELAGTAVALAMDAFAVAIASGISLRRVTGRQTLRMAWHFGMFQALMPFAGWSAGHAIVSRVENIDHWIAFGLLVFVGLRMVRSAWRPEDHLEGRPDPTRGATLLLLSLATSVDALAVGLSLSLLGVDILWPAVVIGAVCFAFTACGLHLGRLVGAHSRIGRWAELAGGIILLAIGLKILQDHGVFSSLRVFES